MTRVDGQRYSAERDRDGVWWGVFDYNTERFVDDRRWLHSIYPALAASKLNHPAPEAGGMSTSDGLGA